MQTEKSQPEGKWMMPETRFTESSTLSVDPRVGISPSAPETVEWLFFLSICIYSLHTLSPVNMIQATMPSIENKACFYNNISIVSLSFIVNVVWRLTPNIICSLSLRNLFIFIRCNPSLLWHQSLFSSPEPKAQGELLPSANVCRPSSVVRRVWSTTASNDISSETARPRALIFGR